MWVLPSKAFHPKGIPLPHQARLAPNRTGHATVHSPLAPHSPAQSRGGTAPAGAPSLSPRPGRECSTPGPLPRSLPVVRSEPLSGSARAAPDRDRCRHGSARSRGSRKPRPPPRADASATTPPIPGGASAGDAAGQSSSAVSIMSASAFASPMNAGSSFRVASAKLSP